MLECLYFFTVFSSQTSLCYESLIYISNSNPFSKSHSIYLFRCQLDISICLPNAYFYFNFPKTDIFPSTLSHVFLSPLSIPYLLKWHPHPCRIICCSLFTYFFCFQFSVKTCSIYSQKFSLIISYSPQLQCFIKL